MILQSTLGEIHFEKHPNNSQSVICFHDIASVLAIDIQCNNIKKQKWTKDWLQFCQNKEEIGLDVGQDVKFFLPPMAHFPDTTDDYFW